MLSVRLHIFNSVYVAEICAFCRAPLFDQRQVVFVLLTLQCFVVSMDGRMSIGLSRFCRGYPTSSRLPMQWPRTLLYVGNSRLTELLTEMFALIVFLFSVQDKWTAYAGQQIAGCETFYAMYTPLLGQSGGKRSSSHCSEPDTRVTCSLAIWIAGVVVSAVSCTCWRFPHSGRTPIFKEEHRATLPYVHTATRYPGRSLYRVFLHGSWDSYNLN